MTRGGRPAGAGQEDVIYTRRGRLISSHFLRSRPSPVLVPGSPPPRSHLPPLRSPLARPLAPSLSLSPSLSLARSPIRGRWRARRSSRHAPRRSRAFSAVFSACSCTYLRTERETACNTRGLVCEHLSLSELVLVRVVGQTVRFSDGGETQCCAGNTRG